MNGDHIKSIFDNIDQFTKDIILTKCKPQLAEAINEVNKKISTIDELSPSPSLILNAFRLCGLKTLRVVIIGQESPTKESNGLCYSVQRGTKTLQSTTNIYRCLQNYGLIKSIPQHGDLSHLSSQGVLLLNCSLTAGVSSHTEYWNKYINVVLQEISALPQNIIFMFVPLDKVNLIDHKKHIVIEHNKYNDIYKDEFIHCTNFARVNEILIETEKTPINWDCVIERPPPHIGTIAISSIGIDDPVPLTKNTLWVFTDGGAIANGKPNCVASWAYYMTDGSTVCRAYGLVTKVDIQGCVYKTSNNRAELTAILFALLMINDRQFYNYENVIIVSDSDLSIQGIDHRNLDKKKNVDLLVLAKDAINIARKKYSVKFRHINSHQKDIHTKGTAEWFLWKGNDIVDKLCTEVLNIK